MMHSIEEKKENDTTMNPITHDGDMENLPSLTRAGTTN
jgi:hypothetical protein